MFYPVICVHDIETLTSLNLQEGFGIDACKPFEQVKETYYRSFGFNKGDETQADTIEDAVS